MKITFILMSLAMANIFAGAAFSDEKAIAIIDFSRVREETHIGKRMTFDIESDKKKKETALTIKRDNILNLEKQLNEDLILTGIQKEDLKNKIDSLQLDLEKEYEKIMNEIQMTQEQYIREYTKKIMPVLQKFSKEKKFSIILSAASVVWAEPYLNVTDEFIKRINAEIE